jgi:hypothetical protein
MIKIEVSFNIQRMKNESGMPIPKLLKKNAIFSCSKVILPWQA